MPRAINFMSGPWRQNKALQAKSHRRHTSLRGECGRMGCVQWRLLWGARRAMSLLMLHGGLTAGGARRVGETPTSFFLGLKGFQAPSEDLSPRERSLEMASPNPGTESHAPPISSHPRTNPPLQAQAHLRAFGLQQLSERVTRNFSIYYIKKPAEIVHSASWFNEIVTHSFSIQQICIRCLLLKSKVYLC